MSSFPNFTPDTSEKNKGNYLELSNYEQQDGENQDQEPNYGNVSDNGVGDNDDEGQEKIEDSRKITNFAHFVNLTDQALVEHSKRNKMQKNEPCAFEQANDYLQSYYVLNKRNYKLKRYKDMNKKNEKASKNSDPKKSKESKRTKVSYASMSLEEGEIVSLDGDTKEPEKDSGLPEGKQAIRLRNFKNNFAQDVKMYDGRVKHFRLNYSSKLFEVTSTSTGRFLQRPATTKQDFDSQKVVDQTSNNKNPYLTESELAHIIIELPCLENIEKTIFNLIAKEPIKFRKNDDECLSIIKEINKLLKEEHYELYGGKENVEEFERRGYFDCRAKYLKRSVRKENKSMRLKKVCTPVELWEKIYRAAENACEKSVRLDLWGRIEGIVGF